MFNLIAIQRREHEHDERARILHGLREVRDDTLDKRDTRLVAELELLISVVETTEAIDGMFDELVGVLADVLEVK